MHSVDALLARLQAAHPKNIDLSLERIHALLARLGNPHLRLPPVIHVAGTNGKGSVVAYLRAILEAAGRRVHVYTSPHLIHFSERIVVAGTSIGESALAATLEAVAQEVEHVPATFFESTTAAAFLAFAQTQADVVLLETGLGGRLDATNVIDRPLLTCITPVAMDHMEYLGATLAGIAREKAGILKKGVPCVLAPQAEEAASVISHHAAIIGSPLLSCGSEWNFRFQRGEILLSWCDTDYPLPSPALAGEHQIANAATAAACALALPPSHAPGVEAIRTGIPQARWPARLQDITRTPWAKGLPTNAALWLDGGHNPHAAAALAAFFAQRQPRPLTLICGMLANREPRAFLRAFARHTPRVIGVPIPGAADAHPANAIAAAAAMLGWENASANTVEEALHFAARTGAPAMDVAICGSLYLAGYVLEHIPPEQR